MAIDPEAKTQGPHAPVQVFPPTNAEDEGHVTATGIRELREEVIAELEQEVAPKSGLNLSIATRVALVILLGVSLFIIAIVFQKERLNSAAPGVPAPAPTAQTPQPEPSVSVVPAPAVAKTEVKPAAPSPLSNSVVRLAEIEVIAALAKEDPNFDAQNAASRLKHYLLSSDVAVKDAALTALGPVLAQLDARARNTARVAAEKAAELADAGRYVPAAKLLEDEFAALSPESPWVVERGRPQIRQLRDQIMKRRADALAEAFRGLEGRLMVQDADAQASVKQLLTHPDEEFAKTAADLQQRVTETLAAKTLEQRRTEAAGRQAWADFFSKFQAAMSSGDLDAAAKLCTPPAADSALHKGGVASLNDVLTACADDIAGIKALLEAALEKASKSEPFAVELPLRKGRVEGMLSGVQGRQLKVIMTGGADVGVKLDQLTAAALSSILSLKELSEKKLMPALWSLTAYENPGASAAYLKRSYDAAKLPLPAHWREYFRIEEYSRLSADVERHCALIKQALDTNNPEKVKDALTVARAQIAALAAIEPLSDERAKLLAGAEALVGKSVRAKVVLQNGNLPTPQYTGQASDQITDYRDSARRTDVGVQWGLKVGASGGLQRVLLRFEGLEAALGKARVISATLEMYQIDSPQAAGAIVGLFRIKRRWVPDGGSWICFDTAKGHEWAVPGAYGEADIEPKEDARVTFDKKKNEWRSWDVTKYVQDVLTGKAQNYGFVMRVINGEPDYHVRLYPESDIETIRDKALRPRLVIDVEREP